MELNKNLYTIPTQSSIDHHLILFRSSLNLHLILTQSSFDPHSILISFAFNPHLICPHSIITWSWFVPYSIPRNLRKLMGDGNTSSWKILGNHLPRFFQVLYFPTPIISKFKIWPMGRGDMGRGWSSIPLKVTIPWDLQGRAAAFRLAHSSYYRLPRSRRCLMEKRFSARLWRKIP